MRKQIWKDLARMGFQHPESLTWENAAGRAKYLDAFDVAKRGQNAEPLMAYMPDGTRRAVKFDSSKSVLNATGDGVDDGFFALDGVDVELTQKRVPHQPYSGPDWATEGLPDELVVSPAGPNGGTFSNGSGVPTIRRRQDGTYELFSNAPLQRAAQRSDTAARASGAWTSYVPPVGKPVVTRTQTGLSKDVPAGTTVVPVYALEDFGLDPGAEWFTVGQTVALDLGEEDEELATIAGLDPLRLKAPLQRAHSAGTGIFAREAAPAAPTTSGSGSGAAPVQPAPAPTVIPPVRSIPVPLTSTSKKTPPAVTTAETLGPKLSAVKLAKSRFSRRTGTKLSFRLDRAARVTVTLQRKVKGHRKGKACSTKAKRGKRCTAYAKAKSTRIKAKEGSTRITFGKKLRRGTYTARVSVASGRRVTLRFVVR